MNFISLILILIQFATPQGFEIFSSTKANVTISRDLLQVSEWMPPWHQAVFDAMQMFWISLGLSLVVFIWKWRYLKFVDVLIFISFVSFSLYSARFVLFYALAVAPIWTKIFDQIFVERETKRVPLINARIILLLVSVMPLAAIVWVNPIAQDQLPLKAIAALKVEVPKGHIYNYREWAGPLYLFGSRDWQLAIDGRLYLYSREEWDRYQKIARGEVSLEDIINKDHPVAFVVRTDYQKGLDTLLKNSPDWRLLAEENITRVYTLR